MNPEDFSAPGNQAPDKVVRDDVIRATNSQNKMPDEALRTTDPIHRQIEALFQQFELYYDRRRGQYKDEGKPIDQIVSVLELLQAVLAIVLKRPDDARARPRKYMRDDRLYTAVFGQQAFSLPVYLKSVLLQRKIIFSWMESNSTGGHWIMGIVAT